MAKTSLKEFQTPLDPNVSDSNLLYTTLPTKCSLVGIHVFTAEDPDKNELRVKNQIKYY